jgi:hypothetical protein
MPPTGVMASQTGATIYLDTAEFRDSTKKPGFTGRFVTAIYLSAFL